MNISDFEKIARQNGIKDDGNFSAKKQRDFLRTFFPDAATDEIHKTYIHAIKTSQIVAPQFSEEDLKKFDSSDINSLVDIGVISKEYRKSGNTGEFFGAADEQSF